MDEAWSAPEVGYLDLALKASFCISLFQFNKSVLLGMAITQAASNGDACLGLQEARPAFAMYEAFSHCSTAEALLEKDGYEDLEDTL